MNWHSFGYCVAAVICVCLLARICVIDFKALRRLSVSMLLVLSLLAVGTGIVAQKTNSVPPNMNSPLPQMMAGGGSFMTGFTGLTRTIHR